MDVKKVLKDPQAHINSQKVPPSTLFCNQLSLLQHQHQNLTKQLKASQAEKGTIARQFKDAKADPVLIEQLKQEMQRASATLGQAEAAVKAVLDRTRELLCTQAPVAKPLLPSRFTNNLSLYGKSLEFYWVVDPNDLGWQKFVAQQGDKASIYHLPAILGAIQTVFGHSSKILIACDQGIIVGGLPLTLVRSRIFGQHAVSVPFFNYGGPLTAYSDVAEQLIEQSRTSLAADAVEQIEIRTTIKGLPFPCSDKKVSMIRRLPAEDAELDTELGAKVRAQVNKALVHKPTVRFGGLELLEDFYRVFAINMRDLGTPVYSKAWFKLLIQTQGLNSILVVCYVNAKPVSVGFLLGYQGILEIPWASTLKSANGLNMNMWMYRQILAHAIAEGYGYFDFGRSTQDASTYKFKKQWGALPVAHYWYYQTPSGQLSGGNNPDNPKFKLLIAIWQKMPVWLTKLIGPPIVKNIP